MFHFFTKCVVFCLGWIEDDKLLGLDLTKPSDLCQNNDEKYKSKHRVFQTEPGRAYFIDSEAGDVLGTTQTKLGPSIDKVEPNQILEEIPLSARQVIQSTKRLFETFSLF